MPFPTAQQGSTVYTLTGPTPGSYVAVFNDETSVNHVGVLTGENAVSGLDSPEVRAAVYDRVEADGSLFGNFYHGNRPITLQGQILASTITERNTRENRLYQALNTLMRGNGVLKWTPTGGVEQSISVRKYQPTRIKGGWVKDFFVSLVAADPFIYSTTLYSTVGVLPATNITPSNEGNAPREPYLLRVTGPTNGTVIFRNVYGGVTYDITLSGFPNLTAGQFIEVDPINRLARFFNSAGDYSANPQVFTNYFQYVDFVNTVWWGLYPGANTVSMRGTNTTGTFRVDYRYTWL